MQFLNNQIVPGRKSLSGIYPVDLENVIECRSIDILPTATVGGFKSPPLEPSNLIPEPTPPPPPPTPTPTPTPTPPPPPTPTPPPPPTPTPPPPPTPTPPPPPTPTPTPPPPPTPTPPPPPTPTPITPTCVCSDFGSTYYEDPATCDYEVIPGEPVYIACPITFSCPDDSGTILCYECYSFSGGCP